MIVVYEIWMADGGNSLPFLLIVRLFLELDIRRYHRQVSTENSDTEHLQHRDAKSGKENLFRCIRGLGAAARL